MCCGGLSGCGTKTPYNCKEWIEVLAEAGIRDTLLNMPPLKAIAGSYMLDWYGTQQFRLEAWGGGGNLRVSLARETAESVSPRAHVNGRRD